MAPSVSRTLAVALVATLVLWLPGGAAAQDPDDALAPPHLSIVEGSVRLERGGEVVQAEVGHILAVGDRLRSDRGRYEVVFGDGSALHVDERTTLDLLDDWLIRLLDGRVFLHVATPPDDLPLIVYRIDTPSATVRATMPGEYRVSSGGRPDVTDVAVSRGLAEVIGSGGSVALHAGERVQARNGQPGAISVYNAAAWDAFDRWSYDRRLAWTDGAHAAYLPRHLTPYSSTLARHGTWSHHPTYGTVWYPHVVADWRPFYHGRWTVLSPYGWTWVGVDPWAWPTHYYGTWSVVSGRWFWIPGRAWSPARVHWVVSSGYIGWLPFGPVGVVHHIGWTIVPRNVFHINVIVPRHAISVYSLRADVRRTFVAQRPPEPRGVAVPRASVISASRAQPSRTAVARGGDAITPGQTPAPSAATATTRRTPTATLRDGTSASDGSRTAVRAGEPDRTTATGSSAIRRLPPDDVGLPTASSDAAGRTSTRTGTAVTRVPPATAAAPTTTGAPGSTGRTAASRAPDAAAVSGGTSATTTGGTAAFPRTAPSTPGTASRAPASTPSAPAASSPQTPAPARAVPRSAPAPEPSAPAASPAPAERAPAAGGVRAAPRSSSSGATTTAPSRTTSAAFARVPAGTASASASAPAASRTAAPARVTPGATAPAQRPAAAPVQRVAPATASRSAGTAATPARPSRPAVSRSPAAAPSRPTAAAPPPAARSAAPVSRAPAASSAPRTTASAPVRSAAAPAASPAAGGRRAPAASSGGSGGGARQR